MTARLFLALTLVFAVPLPTRAEELRYQGKTLAEWARVLKDDDPALRARALQAIAQFGTRAAAALPALQEGLRDPDHFKQIALIQTLGKIGPPALPALLDCLDREELEYAVMVALRDVGYPAVPPLRQGLASEDVVLRRRSIHGLALLGYFAQSALPMVKQALGDRDALVRVRAATALRAIDGSIDPGLQVLLEALKDKDAEIRRLAAAAIVTTDPRAAAPVRAALKDDSARVRVQAAHALWRLDRQDAAFLPVLTEALKDRDDQARADAAKALGEIGTGAKGAIPALLDAVKDTDSPRHLLGIRESLWALGRMGTEAQAAIPTLLVALQDDDAESRGAARVALAAVAGKDLTGMDSYLDLLRHKNVQVRRSAVGLLTLIQLDAGKDQAPLTAALKPLLQDADPTVRLPAADVLAGLGPEQHEAVVRVLMGFLGEPDTMVRWRAAQALRRVAPEALSVLTKGLQDRDPARRRAAAYGLAEIARGGPAPVRELTAALDDGQADVRVQAAFALAWQNSTQGVPVLAAALKDPEWELRQRAIDGLNALGPRAPAALPALAEALADLEDDTHRAAVAPVLGRVARQQPQEVVPALTRALTDPHTPVRKNAAEALWAMGFPNTLNAKPEGGTIAALLGMFDDPDINVSSRAQDAVAVFGDAAVPDLLDALKDREAIRRRGAANALGRIAGNRNQEVLTALSAAFQDPEPYVAVTAARAFLNRSQMSPEAYQRILPLVRTALKDPNPAVRLGAVAIVGPSGSSLQNRPPAEYAALRREALKDPEVTVRRHTVMLMGMSDPSDKEARNDLLALLNDTDTQVRHHAAWRLAAFEPAAPEAVALLLEMLRGADEGPRTMAALAAGQLGRKDPAVAAALINALGEKDQPSARQTVISAVGMLGEAGKPAVGRLVATLRDPNPQVRQQALYSLTQIGAGAAEVVPPLVEVLGSQEDDGNLLNSQLQPLFKALGPAGLTELNKQLADADANRRLGAAAALASLGPAALPSKPALEQALKDEDARVRVRAAGALWLAERKAGPILPTLVQAVQDKDVGVQRRAVELIGLLGPQAKEAVPGLIEALKRKDAILRQRAVVALGRMGPAASAAVPALVAAVNEELSPRGLRFQAVQALGQIGPEAGAAVPSLLPLVGDGDSQVRAAAVQALGRIGPEIKAVSTAVVKALDDPEPAVRTAAVEAVARAGPGCSGDLAKRLQDKDANIRRRVAAQLSQFGPAAKEALPALQQAVEDEDRGVAVQAAEALWKIDRQKTGLPALVRGLVAKDMPVRREAVRVLGAMGPEAKDAVPALLSATQDADNLVRAEALQALQRVDPEAAAKAGKR
jgi:HEAT repeat protein